MTVCMLTPEFVFVLCRIVVFHVHQGVRSGYSYRDSHQMLLLLLLCCSAKGSRFKVWSRKSCEVLLRVWRRNGWVVMYDNPWIPLWSRGVMTQTWLEPFYIPSFSSTCQSFPQWIFSSTGTTSIYLKVYFHLKLSWWHSPPFWLQLAQMSFSLPLLHLWCWPVLSRTSALACGLTPACYLAWM